MVRVISLACLLLLATAAPASAAGPDATRRALAREMARAGAAAGALAVDLESGATLYSRAPDVARVPASVAKLYTTATALRRFGADGHLTTAVVAERAPGLDGLVAGDLYLRGGGDPTFDSAGLSRLAEQVTAAGVTAVGGRIIGDESAFDARRGPPSSGFRTSGYVGPLSALSLNRGLTGAGVPYFQASPARFAADAFARELRRRGVDVGARAGSGTAPATAVPVAQWQSPPMRELSRLTNRPSDNFVAETLLKAVGAGFGGAGSTAAGARVVRAELAGLGISPIVSDGSGLSRSNRTSPAQVVRLLAALAGEPAFVSSLAVAGRSGTLRARMRGTAAQDRCSAKTGTLSSVSALAGYCRTGAGGRVAFAFLMNGQGSSGARRIQDRMTATLARYSGAAVAEPSR